MHCRLTVVEPVGPPFLGCGHVPLHLRELLRIRHGEALGNSNSTGPCFHQSRSQNGASDIPFDRRCQAFVKRKRLIVLVRHNILLCNANIATEKLKQGPNILTALSMLQLTYVPNASDNTR